LDFMNDLVAKYPGKELHVVLDNLNTHKPKDDRLLSSAVLSCPRPDREPARISLPVRLPECN
jgi:hypothetical protein